MSALLDIDKQLSTEHIMLRAQLRRFVETEVLPCGDVWEKQGFIPRPVFERMGELGFIGLGFPPAYGGAGMDTVASVILNEELGRSTFGGLAASISVQTDMSASHLVKSGTEEQRQRCLPEIIAGRKICALGVTEPGGGSDLMRMKSFARKEGDHYVLNGRKIFITNANQADYFFVAARTSSEEKGARGFSLFLVERGFPGFSNGQKFEKTGTCSSDLGELIFDDCIVPVENVIGEEGNAFRYLISRIEHERVCLVSQGIGQAERAIELTLEWLRGRTAYGKTLWDLQAIRHDMARLSCELAAAKLLVYHAAMKSTRGENTTIEACMLKAHVPEVVNRVLYKCVQLHGGMGYMRETPVERMSRDARIHAIGGGAVEVMLDEVAKRM